MKKFLVFLFCNIIISFSALAETVTQSIEGSVNYMQKIALPDNAILEIELIDLTANKIIVKQPYNKLGQVPINFKLNYLSNQVQTNHSYGISARIAVNDQVLFNTTQPYPILNENGNYIVMVLEMVGSSINNDGIEEDPTSDTEFNPPSALLNKNWKLTSIEGRNVLLGNQVKYPFIRFTKDGNFSGSDGCNSFRGTYSLGEDQQIKFSDAATTLMACMDGAKVDNFLTNLGFVSNYNLSTNGLSLVDVNGRPLLGFN